MSNDVHEGIDQVQETPFATKGFSRLSLLAGTAGLTIGGVLSAPAALAQQDRAAGP